MRLYETCPCNPSFDIKFPIDRNEHLDDLIQWLALVGESDSNGQLERMVLHFEGITSQYILLDIFLWP